MQSPTGFWVGGIISKEAAYQWVHQCAGRCCVHGKEKGLLVIERRGGREGLGPRSRNQSAEEVAARRMQALCPSLFSFPTFSSTQGVCYSYNPLHQRMVFCLPPEPREWGPP